MDNLINDFNKFIQSEFDVEFKSNELKKLIGNNTAMFKALQIIMLKFKSKENGELIRKKLEMEDKKLKFNNLLNDLKKSQEELTNLIKVIDEKIKTIKQDNQLIEFYKIKQLRNNELIKLLELVLKSNEIDINPNINLNKIDKLIDLLDFKINLDEISEDKFFIPSQLNYNVLEKQINECKKDINGLIYELTELMKNEDFSLELGDSFIENLTRTDYKINDNQVHGNIDKKEDKRIVRLRKIYGKYTTNRNENYEKNKLQTYNLLKQVEDQKK